MLNLNIHYKSNLWLFRFAQEKINFYFFALSTSSAPWTGVVLISAYGRFRLNLLDSALGVVALPTF